jgi:hypothetical protein
MGKLFYMGMLGSMLLLTSCAGAEVSRARLHLRTEVSLGTILESELNTVNKLHKAGIIDVVLRSTMEDYLLDSRKVFTGLQDMENQIMSHINAKDSAAALVSGEELGRKLSRLVEAIPTRGNALNHNSAFASVPSGRKLTGVRIESVMGDNGEMQMVDGSETGHRGLLYHSSTGPADMPWGLTDQDVVNLNTLAKSAELYMLSPDSKTSLLRLHNTAQRIFVDGEEEWDEELYNEVFRSNFQTTGRTLSRHPVAYHTAPLLIDDESVSHVRLLGDSETPPEQPQFHMTKRATQVGKGWGNLWEELEDLDSFLIPPMTVQQIRASTFTNLPSKGKDESHNNITYKFVEELPHVSVTDPTSMLQFSGTCPDGTIGIGAKFTDAFSQYEQQIPYRDIKIFGIQYVWTNVSVPLNEDGSCTHAPIEGWVAMPHLAAVISMNRFNEAFVEAVVGTGDETNFSVVKSPTGAARFYMLTYPVYMIDYITTDTDLNDYRVEFMRSDMMVDVLNLRLITLDGSIAGLGKGVSGLGEESTIPQEQRGGHFNWSERDSIWRAARVLEIPFSRYDAAGRHFQFDRIAGREGREPQPVLSISSFEIVPPRHDIIRKDLGLEEGQTIGREWVRDSSMATWLAYPGAGRVPEFPPIDVNSAVGANLGGEWQLDGKQGQGNTQLERIIARNTAMIPNTFGPRIVLRDYLEFFYLPNVVDGEDFITTGRLIRINNWSGEHVADNSFATILDGQHNNTGVRLSPLNFLDQRSDINFHRLLDPNHAEEGLYSGEGGSGVLEEGLGDGVDIEDEGEDGDKDESDGFTDVGSDGELLSNGSVVDITPNNAESDNILSEGSRESENTSEVNNKDIELSMQEGTGIDTGNTNQFRTQNPNKWFDHIRPTLRFTGERVGVTDFRNETSLLKDSDGVDSSGSEKVMSRPVLYGLGINLSPHVTGGVGWLTDSNDEHSSLEWFNRWLAENGFFYRINTHRLQAQFSGQFGFDLALHAGLAGPDLTTIENLQKEIDLTNQLKVIGWVNAIFTTVGIALIAWAILLPVTWLTDVNMPLDIKLLYIVSFGQWSAMDNPSKLELPIGYIGFGTVLQKSLVIGVVGATILILRPIGFFVWLVELVGGSVLDFF